MFVSLHCNAHTLKRLSGVETYSLNLASSDDAVRVAARENSVSAKRISDLQFILTDLMLNSKVKESKDLAEQIHVNVVGDLRKSWKVNDHGTREAPFYVLMGAKMPAVLVEVGYVTNADEAARLKSETYLDRLANGIMKGVLNYKKNIERYASL
jgi:N-acetylmuramoyl-L-alanine amidase